ncbi:MULTISPECIES: hypothetical protein [unclassified Rhizobium]|uniref:hypothetical protein n=1 Tax=unclassified Rhizobium TaxID=2613769 RepID=UPI0007E96399|nr:MULTISPECIES: hypothetical protein [unclassified Rhizobium]ANL11996.1 hypothetical protein AMJ98_PA00050 [Rhizobium sp. N1341]ANM42841.1 hypothetical protein AMK03_PA00050 [Rhizobium sp. N741]
MNSRDLDPTDEDFDMDNLVEFAPATQGPAAEFAAYAQGVKEALIALPSIEVPFVEESEWMGYDPDVPFMNAEIARAHRDLTSVWRTLECLQDRFELLARAHRTGQELSSERVDAKHGIAGKRIEIVVDNAWGNHPVDGDWNKARASVEFDQSKYIDLATSGAYHLSYERREDDEMFAIALLFESLGFVSNGNDDPVWTVYSTPPKGTIRELRDGLERLGYHYRLWTKRTYRIEGELGDDDRECSLLGAPEDHVDWIMRNPDNRNSTELPPWLVNAV